MLAAPTAEDSFPGGERPVSCRRFIPPCFMPAQAGRREGPHGPCGPAARPCRWSRRASESRAGRRAGACPARERPSAAEPGNGRAVTRLDALNPAPGFRIRRVVGGAGGHGVTHAGALQCQCNPKPVLSLRAGGRWGGRGGGGLSGSARLAHSPIASSESSRPLSPRPVAAARRNRARAARVPSESRLFRVRAGRASRGGER